MRNSTLRKPLDFMPLCGVRVGITAEQLQIGRIHGFSPCAGRLII
jgi:hypothetical protein